MIVLQNVFLPLDTDFDNCKEIVSAYLKAKVDDAFLLKKSVDARKKDNVCFCCSFVVSLSVKTEAKLIKSNKNVSEYKKYEYNWHRNTTASDRPVVVGFGPAGMFATLLLARSGLKPIVVERGDDVDTRTRKINEFFNGRKLDKDSNVQFGEGGAGTFSDGKLNTGIKNPRCRVVLEEFVNFGAKDNILYDAKPHIGTDYLVKIVKNIRNEIISLGGEIRFRSTVTSFAEVNGQIKSVILDNGEIINTDRVILATGHSARDIFSMLKENNIALERKPFAMGVRIEHLQKDIDKSLYGDFSGHNALGAASYKLAVHLKNGRGVYTFCMCPGGEVINASGENQSITVNGMSYNARNGVNSNSALLVGVSPDDIDGDDVLGGCYLQQRIEQKAFSLANGKVPITTVGHFVYGKKAELGRIKPTVKPETCFCELEDIFPSFITDSLKEGIPLLDRRLEGFACADAVITAPETRSSSPVRILRNENCVSVSLNGLYPCGEGAGYAGGIISAAVDGLLCAEKLIESYA